MRNQTHDPPSNDNTSGQTNYRSSDKIRRLVEWGLSQQRPPHTPLDETACCDDETLSAYLDRTLTANERTEVELHLAQCPRCVHELASLHDLIKVIQAETGESNPERTEISRPQPRWQWVSEFLQPWPRPAFAGLVTACLVLAVGLFWWVSQNQTPLTVQMPESSAGLEYILPSNWLKTEGEANYIGLGVASAATWLGQSAELEKREYIESVSRLKAELDGLGHSGFTAPREASFEKLRRNWPSLTMGNGGEDAETLQNARQLDSDVLAHIRQETPEQSADFQFGRWVLAVGLYAQQAQTRLAEGETPTTELSQLHELLSSRWTRQFGGHLDKFNARAAFENARDRLEQNPTLDTLVTETRRILKASLSSVN
jgi:hypothetical protein